MKPNTSTIDYSHIHHLKKQILHKSPCTQRRWVNESNNRRNWPNGSGQQTLYEKLKKKVSYGLFPEFKWWIDSPYYSRLYTITCNILYKAIFFFRLNSQYTFKANQCKCRNLLMALPKYIFTGLQFYLYRTRNTFMYIISPILRHSRGQLLKSR